MKPRGEKMYCLTCKKLYSDTEEKCPHCGASPIPERCPECYVKLSAGEDVCKKCGCDIMRHIKEKEEKASYVAPSFKDKLKALPWYVKAGLPLALIVLIITAISAVGYIKLSRRAEAKYCSEMLITRAEESVDMITEMAGYYEDDVYNRDWISHIENAEKLRETHADKIKEMNSIKEPISYANRLVANSGDEELTSLADDVYYAYVACYSYVIGENGKYPHYLKNYNKLLAEYEEAVNKLKKAIE